VYEAAPSAAEQGVQTVSIDEMTGIQALERAAPSLPMKPSLVERRELAATGGVVDHPAVRLIIAKVCDAIENVRLFRGRRRTHCWTPWRSAERCSFCQPVKGTHISSTYPHMGRAASPFIQPT
jgi:hypothetical protein